MKNKNHILTLAITLCLLTANSSYANHHDNMNGHDHSTHAHAHGDHSDHDSHIKEAGPNGGRLITSVEPHLEFYVTEESFVQITFLDEENQAIEANEASISLIGGDRQNPVRLSFEKNGHVLKSTKALPEGTNLPIVLSMKTNKTLKTIREKFYLNLSDCPTCKYKEYACICSHGENEEDGHEGHNH